MTTFRMNLEDIQPSQLYISRKKLDRILEAFDKDMAHKTPPVPIKELDGEMISTDGHTRALAWYLKGHSDVLCEWEDVEMDWEEYRICVEWCKEAGIRGIPDLHDKIISAEDYKILWLGRCWAMQKELEEERAQSSANPE